MSNQVRSLEPLPVLPTPSPADCMCAVPCYAPCYGLLWVAASPVNSSIPVHICVSPYALSLSLSLCADGSH